MSACDRTAEEAAAGHALAPAAGFVSGPHRISGVAPLCVDIELPPLGSFAPAPCVHGGRSPQPLGLGVHGGLGSPQSLEILSGTSSDGGGAEGGKGARLREVLRDSGVLPNTRLTVHIYEHCSHNLEQHLPGTHRWRKQRRWLQSSRTLVSDLDGLLPEPVSPLRFTCPADGDSFYGLQQRNLPTWPTSQAVNTVTSGLALLLAAGLGAPSPSPSPLAEWPWPSSLLRDIVLDVARAMAYLHFLDLVHGDLMLGNVFLKALPAAAAAGDGGGGGSYFDGGNRRFICLLDHFALTNHAAAVQEEGLPLTTHSVHWRGLSHQAPEVVTEGRSDRAADVYSYGALLWHLVTGVPPHASLHPAQILVGLASGGLSLEWPHAADPTLRKIGESCLQQDPQLRPSFDQIVQWLCHDGTAFDSLTTTSCSDGEPGQSASPEYDIAV